MEIVCVLLFISFITNGKFYSEKNLLRSVAKQQATSYFVIHGSSMLFLYYMCDPKLLPSSVGALEYIELIFIEKVKGKTKMSSLGAWLKVGIWLRLVIDACIILTLYWLARLSNL